jgi:hypothetical protein
VQPMLSWKSKEHCTFCGCVCSLSYPACIARGCTIFSTLSKKLQDFREKVIERKPCVLLFSTTLLETFVTLRRIPRVIIINVYRSSSKVRSGSGQTCF